ncbi:MAG: MotA/TolQ/ExbB proton channel family protein [Bryobacterales bacterium]|nr:MotA/TolQ/ExbB proton channel family protein [Bryobacterales bacterium]
MRDSTELRVRAAMRRAAAVEFEQLQVDVASLAAIASVAPWLGVLATVFGIAGSFRGVCGNKYSMLAALAGSLSFALWPTAAGVGVAVLALAVYRCLLGRVASLRASTRIEAEGVLRLLLRERIRWEFAHPAVIEEPVLWKQYHAKRHRWQIPVSVLLFAAALGMACAAYVLRDGYHLRWAVFHGVCDVALQSTIAAVPAHVLCVRVWGGSAEGRTVALAAFCFLWCAAECWIAASGASPH